MIYLKKVYRFFPKLQVGIHMLQEIGKFAHHLGGKRILLITEPIFRNIVNIERIEKLCEQYRIQVDTYYVSDIKQEIIDIKRISISLRKKPYDVLIGFGNEHLLNYTKILAIHINNERDIFYYLKENESLHRAKPTILIPSMITTGTEITPTIFIYEKKRMTYFNHPFFAPSIIIYDPVLSIHNSPYNIASSSVLSLAQAFETYLFASENNYLAMFALKAIKLLSNYIIRVVFNIEDFEAHEAVLRAGMLIGMARCNQSCSSFTYSFASPISKKANIPYEIAVAVMFPYINYIYSKINKQRINHIINELGLSIDNEEEAVVYLTSRLINVIRAVGFPTNLVSVGINVDELITLSKEAFFLWQGSECSKKSHRVIEEDFKTIYKNAYSGRIESSF